MRRRTFFKTMGSNLALLLMPRWLRPKVAAAQTVSSASLTEVAGVVLPESLGAKRIGETVVAFEAWVAGYPAGADAGYGYGDPRPTVLGPSPSLHYAEQLQQLDAAGAGGFAKLSMQGKRELLQSTLAQAGVSSIPPRPNGKHVATDLMSYFYGSSDGKDLCYKAAIRESDCRGLGSSAERPAALSERS
jgi:hypothetical protein